MTLPVGPGRRLTEATPKCPEKRQKVRHKNNTPLSAPRHQTPLSILSRDLDVKLF